MIITFFYATIQFNDEDIHKLCTWMDNKIAEIGKMDLPSDEIDSLKLQMEEHEVRLTILVISVMFTET